MKQDQLTGFLGSHARARLLAHFVARPGSRIHGRSLERLTSLGKRSIQLELGRLVDMGLLICEPQGRRHMYRRRPNEQWQAVSQLVSSYGPLAVLQNLLRDIEGLKAAFVFGSMARGDARPDSDIDIVLYGGPEAELGVARAVLDAALVLDRPIDTKWYDRQRFLADVQEGASFLPAAMKGPKIWLFGSSHSLPREHSVE